MLAENRQKLVESFRVKCRKHKLSMTPQRLAVYTELIKSTDHPDSEDIYQRVKTSCPDISLDTVYRTLSKFAEIGVVDLVEGYGESKRYDPDTDKHHHLRCTQCNKIIDFHDEQFDNLKIPRMLQKNFRVTNVKVILEGRCSDCSKNL